MAALLLSGTAVQVSSGEGSLKTDHKPLIAFSSYRLANGLRVVLAPDHTVPVVGLCVAYAVGSVDELPGQSGLAHLCEHLMSQGSAHVGRDEHRLLVQETGGSQNATTGQDETDYYETLPADQLDLGLFLEADRMGSLEVNQQAFENQRAVVKSEKRERHDDQIYSDLQRTMLRLGYSRFGYGHPTIGDNAGLDAASLTQARSFYRTYYLPNNAVLTLTGDFDMATAQELIAKRFEAIPSRKAPARADTTEPAFMPPGHAALTDPFNSLPCYEIAYRTPAMMHRDDAALTLLADILGGGRSSRLGIGLVEPEEALTAHAQLRDRRGPGLFVVWATLPPRAPFGPVAAKIDRAIADIQTGGVTAAELAKAKAIERNEESLRLYSAVNRARELAAGVILQNDPGAVNRHAEEEEAVMAADIRRVAQQYLWHDTRLAVTVVPYTDPRANTKDPQ